MYCTLYLKKPNTNNIQSLLKLLDFTVVNFTLIFFALVDSNLNMNSGFQAKTNVCIYYFIK